MIIISPNSLLIASIFFTVFILCLFYIIKQKVITEYGTKYKIQFKASYRIKIAEVLMILFLFLSVVITVFGIGNAVTGGMIRAFSLLGLSYAIYIYSKEAIRLILSNKEGYSVLEWKKRCKYAKDKSKTSRIQVGIIAGWGLVYLFILCIM